MPGVDFRTAPIVRTKTNVFLGLTLLLSVFLWGASNAGTKYVVTTWPPIWTGGSRMTCAGLLLLVLFRFKAQPRGSTPLPSAVKWRLWLRGGLSLATYIAAFNWALHFTLASHVALYLGCSPIWALLWEGKPLWNVDTIKRYVAALLALAGLFVLFLPALKPGSGAWAGELLALVASVLWTVYGRECRRLTKDQLTGAEISAHTMWRAGILLLGLSGFELYKTAIIWRPMLVWVQIYCVVVGGVITFSLWNNALKYWPTSQVFLFNNLIPISTMTWSWALLGEPVTSTFWAAMVLVFSGVVLGQLKQTESPSDALAS
jgi:drug/metabolite transporter (DMT)-like permease